MGSLFQVPPSPLIRSFEWTSELWTLPQREVMGDTYPVTWAEDGSVFTSAGDPNYGPSYDGLDVSRFEGAPPSCRVIQVNPMPEYTGSGGHGFKPSGIISVGDSLYLAVQNSLGWKPPAWGRDSQHGSDANIIVSADKGLAWSPLPRKPMFPGPRFGGPSFVQYGKGLASPEGHVYAVSGDQWDNGCDLRVGRAPVGSLLDPGSWTYVTGFGPQGEPIWERWLHAAVPVLSLPRMLGLPEMVYLEGLKRHLLLTWSLPKEFDTSLGADLIIFDSPTPWGPFSLAHFEREWLGRDVCPYCPRLPLAWMDEDGLGGWLLTSGTWNPPADPTRPYYKPNAQRFRIRLR